MNFKSLLVHFILHSRGFSFSLWFVTSVYFPTGGRKQQRQKKKTEENLKLGITYHAVLLKQLKVPHTFRREVKRFILNQLDPY